MFNILRKAIRSFKKDQSGVTAIEYGLIAIIMAAFIIFAFYKNIVPALESDMTSLTKTIKSVKFEKAATGITLPSDTQHNGGAGAGSAGGAATETKPM